MPPQPQQFDFASLAAKFGVPVALQLLALIDPNASTASKAFSGAKTALPVGTAAASAAGYKLPSGAGTAGTGALAAAQLGFNLSKIANAQGLSQTQKAGLASKAAFDAGVSFIPVAGPIYASAQLGRSVGEQLEKSKSPQVSGLGRGIHQVATPSGENAFWDVATGMRSPKAAIAAHGGFEGGMMDTMGPIGAILKGLNVHLPFLHHDPTTGTMFRSELDRLFQQIPALKGTPTNQYNIDPATYAGLPQGAKDIASQLGTQLSGFTRDASKNPQAYANQVSAILLNKFGAGLPSIAPDVLKLLQGAR